MKEMPRSMEDWGLYFIVSLCANEPCRHLSSGSEAGSVTGSARFSHLSLGLLNERHKELMEVVVEIRDQRYGYKGLVTWW